MTRDVPEAADLWSEVNLGDSRRVFELEVLQDGGEVEEELHAGQSFTQAVPLSCRRWKEKGLSKEVLGNQKDGYYCLERWLFQTTSKFLFENAQ